MLELFTERGRRVIALAQGLASDAPNRTVSVERLLAAALRVDGGRPACAALGLSQAQMQQALISSTDESRNAVPDSIPLAPEAKWVMYYAAIQAEKADSRADVSHLLVQLLSIDDANVDQIVEGLGVDREELHRRANEQSAADERRPQARLRRIQTD